MSDDLVLAAARAAEAAGLCIVPPAEDGTKRPLPDPSGKWEAYKTQRPTPDELGGWYPGRSGLGVIVGEVSGRVECWDFDERPTYDAFVVAAGECGLIEAVERIDAGYHDDTPGGGVRWLVRYAADVVREPKGEKLARRPGREGEPKIKTLIELPAFAIVAPSNGKVHPSGRPYVHRAGGFTTIASYTTDERDALIGLARSFDDMPRAAAHEQIRATGSGGTRPGDIWATATRWADILAPHGWAAVYARGDVTCWRRPGKKLGISATTNHGGSDLLYVFSSSTEFEPEKSYTKFGAFAVLEHRGDFTAAAKALAAQGYGGEPARAREPERPACSAAEAVDDDDRAAEERPEVRIRQELNAVTGEALGAVVSRPDLGVYVRGRMLVTVGRDGSARERWLHRPPGSPVIVPIEHARMLAMLDNAARWTKFVARDKAWVTARPPEWVATQILARLEWPFPYLDAVVETPTIRPDGSILDTPGWDEATGLLYSPMPGLTWEPVPARPNTRDIAEATGALLDPVRDFPFVDVSDQSAFVAAVLTLVARHKIDGPAPMFPVRAPTPGTGKGLLAQVIGLIGTGRVPPVMTMAYDGDELRKRITSLAVSGAPVVLLDNISGSVGSDTLAAALTATEWEDRVLGATQMVRVPMRMVWLATGNNVGFRRTLGRRVVPIDLDAKLEQPEDRTTFAYADLLAHVRAKRPRLVTAALTLLRGFCLAGSPAHGQARMGSYEAWDDAVRSAVIWAGFADPAGTDVPTRGRGRVREQADDDADKLVTLLEAVEQAYPGGAGFRAGDLSQRANENPDLRAVLDALAAPKKGGRATSASIGAALREQRDRPLGGRVFRYERPYWRIERS